MSKVFFQKLCVFLESEDEIQCYNHIFFDLDNAQVVQRVAI